MVRFYTLPPWRVRWPYILLNSRSSDGLRYLISYNHRTHVKSIMIDTGVERFRDPRVKDYHGGYRMQVERQKILYDKIRRIAPQAEVYVTVPDYPDDYNPKSLWLSGEYTNIERTIESILHAIEKYPHVNWLIPLQGHYKRPSSLVRGLEQLLKRDFPFEKYGYYAVANLCTDRDCKTIELSVKYVYGWFERTLGHVPRLHLFGPKIPCIRKVRDYIFSFDSMAWTRPVELGLHKQYPYSAKNDEQRELFFKKYIEVLEQRIGGVVK